MGDISRAKYVGIILFTRPSLSWPQRCPIFGNVTLAIFNKVISAGARYRARVYVPPVCLWPAISSNVLVCFPSHSSRAGGDLFYYLQLVSAATPYTQRRSATCARVSAKNTAAVYRDLTTRPYFRPSVLGGTVLKTCIRILTGPML